jgi:predicted transposase YdaD
MSPRFIFLRSWWYQEALKEGRKEKKNKGKWKETSERKRNEEENKE